MITTLFKHFIKGITFNIKLVSPNNAKSYDNITITNKLVYDYHKKMILTTIFTLDQKQLNLYY